MGGGRVNISDLGKKAKEAKASNNSGFTAVSMCDEFNPKKVNTRFSKRGPFNQFKDPITVLVGLDVTGSMDKIPKSLLTGKLGSLMVDLKKTFNQPNENLQISFAGIGDAKTDKAPLQVTHFESDNRFAQQLEKIWLEGGGGGNGGESYNLLWWYAANKTRLNYVKQDERKGILITIGDDHVHPTLTASEIRTSLDPEYDGVEISNQVLLNAVREQYEVYHIVVTDGQAYERNTSTRWRDLLGLKNVIDSASNGVADAIAEIVTQHKPIQRTEMMNLTEEEWAKQNKENLTDEQWQEVLSYTLCPLTREFMNRPVCWGSNKRAYEELAVEDYTRKHQMDPITHTKLTSKLDLTLNLNIAQLCLDYKYFFDALPEIRKERLVQLTLGQTLVEHKKTDERGKNSHKFFPEEELEKEKEEPEKGIEEIEEEYKDCICSITHQVMKEPVILATGITYERKAIEKWLENHDTCPATGQTLEHKNLVRNIALKDRCEEARAKLAKLESKHVQKSLSM